VKTNTSSSPPRYEELPQIGLTLLEVKSLPLPHVVNPVAEKGTMIFVYEPNPPGQVGGGVGAEIVRLKLGIHVGEGQVSTIK